MTTGGFRGRLRCAGFTAEWRLVHNAARVSPLPTRFLATVALASLGVLLGAAPVAAALDAPNTWTPLAALPERLDSPLLALAVSPADPAVVVAGTPSGAIYRSADGGTTWKAARTGLGHGVVALTFDPLEPGLALAGSVGGGAWRSVDAGLTWQPQPGAENRTVRAFAFARSMTVAGTDSGLLLSRQGGPWTPVPALDQVAVSAVAAAAINDPASVMAGGDATGGTEALPLYASADGAKSWKPVPGAIGGSSVVSVLAAGPLAAGQSHRPMLMGTNTGLFASDDGANWQPVTGSGGLPATDFNAAAFDSGNGNRFYAASDGGGSNRGGLWVTVDSGAHFTSLQPPVAAVSALALAAGSQPHLYVATFRPIDHAVMLWSYRDAGGAPQGPKAGVPAPAPQPGQAAARAPAPRSPDLLTVVMHGPEAPFIVLGAAAVGVLLLAMAAYARRTRGL